MRRRSTFGSSNELTRRPSLVSLDFLGNIGQALSDLFFDSIGFNNESSTRINNKYSGKNVLGDQNIDYHKEGDTLLQRLNLDTQTIGNIKNRTKKSKKDRDYNSLDPIYRRPNSPATIYVGDRHAASDINLLKKHKITSVINCTRPADTGELPNYCEGSHIRYYEFPIATWSYYLFPNKSREEWMEDNPATQQELNKIRDFFQRMFQFIQDALDRNESVLIHCLAGAHRAGSCGVAVLMYFLDLELAKAVFLAKLCRPIIDPIGSLPKVLMLLDEEMKSKRKKNFDEKIDGSKKGDSRKADKGTRASFDGTLTNATMKKAHSYDKLKDLKDEMNLFSGGVDSKLAPVFTSRKGQGHSKYKSKLARTSIDIASLGFLQEDDKLKFEKFKKALDNVEALEKLPIISTKTMPNISSTETLKFPPLRRVHSSKT